LSMEAPSEPFKVSKVLEVPGKVETTEATATEAVKVIADLSEATKPATTKPATTEPPTTKAATTEAATTKPVTTRSTTAIAATTKVTTTQASTTTTAATPDTTTSEPVTEPTTTTTENVCKPFAEPNKGAISCTSDVREGSICKLECEAGWTTNGGRSALCKCGKRSCWWTSTNLGYCSAVEDEVAAPANNTNSYNDEAGQEEFQESANAFRDDCPAIGSVGHGDFECTKGRQIFSVCKLACDEGFEEIRRKNIMRCRCANKFGQSPSKCSWRGKMGECKNTNLYADSVQDNDYDFNAGAAAFEDDQLNVQVRKLDGGNTNSGFLNDIDDDVKGIDSNTNQCKDISEHLGYGDGSFKHGSVECTDYGVCTVSCKKSYYRKGPMEYYCKCAYNEDKGCLWRPKRSVQCLPYRGNN
jgi:hypothetical protein